MTEWTREWMRLETVRLEESQKIVDIYFHLSVVVLRHVSMCVHMKNKYININFYKMI